MPSSESKTDSSVPVGAFSGGGVTDEIRVGEVNKQAVSYSNIGETLQECVCPVAGS